MAVILFTFLSSCDPEYRNKLHGNVPRSSIKKGKAFAAVYCQSCHMLPDPAWVDDKTWETATVEHSENGLTGFEQWLKTYEEHIPVHISQMKRNFEAWKSK